MLRLVHVLGLLAILTTAVVIGKVVRRITPGVELLLLLLVATVILVEFVHWTGHAGSATEQIARWLVPGRH